jgi:hypothetical protein
MTYQDLIGFGIKLILLELEQILIIIIMFFKYGLAKEVCKLH